MVLAFLRDRAAGRYRLHFATRARSTIPGSMSPAGPIWISGFYPPISCSASARSLLQPTAKQVQGKFSFSWVGDDADHGLDSTHVDSCRPDRALLAGKSEWVTAHV